MLREATREDAAAIDAFLVPYTETSMFLRGNIFAHGIGWSEDRHSTRVWIWEDAGIHAVFGLTKGGYLMIQMPEILPRALASFANAVVGETVIGMTGATDQVGPALAALNLQDRKYTLLRVEPLYRLSLADLPVNVEQSRPVLQSDIPVLEEWFADYLIDIGTVPSRAEAEKQAATRAANAPGSTVQMLIQDGATVAMASLHAQVDGTVQVGGVYVPPELRNRGLGRKVVTALLSNAMANGAQEAILFAASETAAHVYETIGFHKIGTYKLAILTNPVEITAS